MNDLKFAFRQLLKNPGFTAVAVLTLALGIGANTAIFSLIDHVMLRLLPVNRPRELLVVPGQFSYPRYEQLRDRNEVFSDIQVGPGYFTKVGIPLLLGRDITERDSEGAPRVAVINETMAKFYFSGGNPIGKKIGTHVGNVGNQQFQLEIVGVARDTQDHSLWSEPLRRFYVSYFQPIDGITTANFEIRTDGNPGQIAAMLRREVQTVDRNLMILGIRNLKGLMDQTLVQEHLIAKLSALFGLLAVSLAAIGLYGVVAYEVTQRTNEIGLRMALGAQRWDVLKLVLKHGMSLTVLGITLGLLGAAVFTRVIKSQLYEVSATDPAAYAGMSLLLVIVALFACWLPARRATKVNPMEALRYD